MGLAHVLEVWPPWGLRLSPCRVPTPPTRWAMASCPAVPPPRKAPGESPCAFPPGCKLQGTSAGCPDTARGLTWDPPHSASGPGGQSSGWTSRWVNIGGCPAREDASSASKCGSWDHSDMRATVTKTGRARDTGAQPSPRAPLGTPAHRPSLPAVHPLEGAPRGLQARTTGQALFLLTPCSLWSLWEAATPKEQLPGPRQVTH